MCIRNKNTEMKMLVLSSFRASNWFFMVVGVLMKMSIIVNKRGR